MLTKDIRLNIKLCTGQATTKTSNVSNYNQVARPVKMPGIRSSTLRLGIFISTLIIATILVFQLVWLKKVYRFEQKEFDHSVIKAVRGLYEDLAVPAYNISSMNELMEKPGRHLYLARISRLVNHDSLSRYLQYELEDFEIFTSCQMGLYSQQQGGYIYTSVLHSPIGKEEKLKSLPDLQRPYDYMLLSFPNREQYILSQLNFWIISSAVLLVVLILLGASVYYFYKQKFLNETQKDFIHNFTHEFKTPVAVLGLAADVLKNKNIIEKPEKLATYAGIVEYQADYLNRQIERLLKFAYTDSGTIHLEKQTVDIHSLIEEAVTNLNPLITSKHAELNYVYEATQPTLQADKGYLMVVIINLLDNALKYSRNPVITISTANKENNLLLSVKDNGIGIEQKQLRHLFDKFYRVKNGDVQAAAGFGIGLSFVKKIAVAHGGKVTVQSEPGKGSEFTLSIPLK
jgi:two-component system, OmpR family, phosphate regulon sensor histidine kinase PhoR